MKGKFFPVEMRRKDGGSLLLREAEEGDAGAVLAYLNQVGGESDNLLFGRDEFAMPLEQERQWIASLRKQEKSILLLGICEDELSSVASVSAFDRRERIAHRAEVAVSVKKACWGLGIGRPSWRHSFVLLADRGWRYFSWMCGRTTGGPSRCTNPWASKRWAATGTF